jgi:hypothetical protein
LSCRSILFGAGILLEFWFIQKKFIVCSGMANKKKKKCDTKKNKTKPNKQTKTNVINHQFFSLSLEFRL